jgi:outer membrane protein assembly factor BamB
MIARAHLRAMTGVVAACGIVGATAVMRAQGRGGAQWSTSHGDAQRTSWIKTDPRISIQSLQKGAEGFGAFKFLWKLKVENDSKPVNPLTPPVLLDQIIGFRGFKSVAFVATSTETVYAIDTDFGVQLWKVHLNYGASFPPLTTSTPACPGGLTASLTRPTPLSMTTFAGGGGGFGRGGRSGGGVGEPGRGAPSIYTAGQGRGGAAPAASGLPQTPGTPVPESAAAAAQAGRAGGGRGRGQGFGAPEAAYVIGSDGYVRALNVQNGWELSSPVQLLPANTRPAAPILINDDTDGFLYVATTQGCAYTPDAVWGVDLTSPKLEVVRWDARGATVAGSAGISLGRDGTIYVATADGTSPLSNSVVALEPKTLKQKAVFTQAKSDFATSPVVFTYKDKDLVAVAGKDGRVYVLDGASLQVPLAASAPTAGAELASGDLASWQDDKGTRWILAPTNNTIAAFRVVEEGSGLALQRDWISRELTSPVTPMIVNGVVFALSSGEPRSSASTPRAQRPLPAVLYALDASTGKELWNSGKTITSSGRAGLAGGAGVVYVPTVDSTLYAFGFAIEK